MGDGVGDGVGDIEVRDRVAVDQVAADGVAGARVDIHAVATVEGDRIAGAGGRAANRVFRSTTVDDDAGAVGKAVRRRISADVVGGDDVVRRGKVPLIDTPAEVLVTDGVRGWLPSRRWWFDRHRPPALRTRSPRSFRP